MNTSAGSSRDNDKEIDEGEIRDETRKKIQTPLET